MTTTTRHRAARLRNASSGRASGYVVLYGEVVNLGHVKESIERGAFTEAIRRNGPHVPLLWAHDHTAGPIGTATLSSTGKGLRAELTFFLDDPRARGVYRTLERHAVGDLDLATCPRKSRRPSPAWSASPARAPWP